ncbi:uncharacterized protein DUF3761 [Motilibacter peucedani]|uniref:Uncharacterized protein DUF3761 n=1 Tax=Motilibacter peucedani TaxID=598650 RepID=A0A420XRR7_9ACTN|nr:DUF3761 domain-containing protein [Motilibacter peucedani]RKS77596.1 uncharacterized protein DUF3761 [Motilibacter peucedani]
MSRHTTNRVLAALAGVGIATLSIGVIAPAAEAAPSHSIIVAAKPMHPRGPGGATAKCRDGSYSHSKHRQGTCSHHHGVARWY